LPKLRNFFLQRNIIQPWSPYSLKELRFELNPSAQFLRNFSEKFAFSPTFAQFYAIRESKRFDMKYCWNLICAFCV